MGTSKKSTGQRSSDPTCYVVAIRVSHSAPPENDKGKPIRVTCGPGSEKPLASYNPDTQSWKMYGDTFLSGDSPSLVNLPPSGMTQNGVLFPQPAWVPITDVTESSLLHTPTATMNQMAPSMKSGWWPTPRSSKAMADDMETTQRRLEKIGYKVRLEEAVARTMWPTPVVGAGAPLLLKADPERLEHVG